MHVTYINFYCMYKVMEKSSDTRLNLQLGDIVEIQAPTDEELNNKQFIDSVS